MRTKGTIASAVAALTLALSGTDVQAAVVTIDQVVDGWQNVQEVGPDTDSSINNQNNPLPDTVFWGQSAGSGRSGYIWDSRDTGFDVTTGDKFSLGRFTHVNRPIQSGTSITSVELAFSVGDFGSPLTLGATFLFNHNETPNSGDGCCNDLVTISNVIFNAPFTDGGNHYFFSLLGFSTDGGLTTTHSFSTKEGKSNEAKLYAIITEEPINEPVPEPTTLLLFGSGLAASAWRARRRRS